MHAVKNKVNGSWLITDVVAGYLMQRVYYGYTKREAMSLFREEAKQTRNER